MSVLGLPTWAASAIAIFAVMFVWIVVSEFWYWRAVSRARELREIDLTGADPDDWFDDRNWKDAA